MEAVRSDNAVLDALLAAAFRLHPQTIDLGLARLERLLGRLGNPHHRLPPVFHVAGTNGKGSTVAFIRAALEASGRHVHVYTSPHLVRFNERIRVAGKLIDDDSLIVILRDVLDANGTAAITFFELTTAAAFLAFARHPADATVVEVGMGGRLDATNLVRPIVTGISALGYDHQQWLGDSILAIAGEKAGIAKRGVPLVTSRYPKAVQLRIAEVAGVAGAPVLQRGDDWDAAFIDGAIEFRDQAGAMRLPPPRLAGAHQFDNAALAVAMLRAQSQLPVAPSALRAAMGWVEWPARLQLLERGPLLAALPPVGEVWLDGAHNPSAARAIVDSFRPRDSGQRSLHVILGMLAAKDLKSYLRVLTGHIASVHAVAVDGQSCHSPEAITQAARAESIPASASPSITSALRAICRTTPTPAILITGSLHLAGQVLAANNQTPA